MTDPAQILRDLKPAKKFFIGIDSDGCVFDSMEIKHKECFAPMFIKHFHLQAASKYAREVWDFVNLYSKTRGVNRFPALSRALNLLRERPQVKARNVPVPDTKPLDDWMAAVRRTRARAAVIGAIMTSDGAAAHAVGSGLRAMEPDLVVAFGGSAALEPRASGEDSARSMHLPDDVAEAVAALRDALEATSTT